MTEDIIPPTDYRQYLPPLQQHLAYAYALHHLFEDQKDRERLTSNTFEVAERLAREVKLEGIVQERFQEVTENLDKAKRAIRGIVNLYGVDSDNILKNQKELYQKLMRTKKDEEISIDFGGFYLTLALPKNAYQRYFNKDSIGSVRNPVYTNTLDKILDSIKKGKITQEMLTLTAAIDKSHGDDSKDFLRFMLGNSRTEEHEIRHIIDNIIFQKNCFPTLVELPAYMYEEGVTKANFNISLEELKKKLKISQGRFEEVSSNETPGVIKRMFQKSYERDKSNYENLSTMDISMFAEIANLGLPQEIQSYLVSTTPLSLVPERMTEVRDNLRARKAKH